MKNFDTEWEYYYEDYVAFQKTGVSKDITILSLWVDKQRIDYRNGVLSQERYDALFKAGFYFTLERKVKSKKQKTPKEIVKRGELSFEEWNERIADYKLLSSVDEFFIKQSKLYKQGLLTPEKQEVWEKKCEKLAQRYRKSKNNKAKRKAEKNREEDKIWRWYASLCIEYLKESHAGKINSKLLYKGVAIGNWYKTQIDKRTKGEKYTTHKREKQETMRIIDELLEENKEYWEPEVIKERGWYEYADLCIKYLEDTQKSEIQRDLEYKGVELGEWYYAQLHEMDEDVHKWKKMGLIKKVMDINTEREWCEHADLCIKYLKESKAVKINRYIEYKGVKIGGWFYKQKNKIDTENKHEKMECIRKEIEKNKEYEWDKNADLCTEYLKESKAGVINKILIYKGVEIGKWFYKHQNGVDNDTHKCERIKCIQELMKENEKYWNK